MQIINVINLAKDNFNIIDIKTDQMLNIELKDHRYWWVENPIYRRDEIRIDKVQEWNNRVDLKSVQ